MYGFSIESQYERTASYVNGEIHFKFVLEPLPKLVAGASELGLFVDGGT